MISIRLVVVPILALASLVSGDYEPNWDSLDARPLPDWYDKAKVGIFIHWGIFTVPSISSEWFWNSWAEGSEDLNNFMAQNYPPGFTYQEFAKEFTAEFYDPDRWVDIFKRSGAQYVVLTSKHHEGYTLWPSKYSFSWNANDVGPHRDLLGDLAQAVKQAGLHFGVYHSLLEWYNPLYLQDKANNWNTSDFVDNKVIPEMKELITLYEPEVLWSDGNWEGSDDYWKSTQFLAWLYNESPVKDVIVANDRWGYNTQCVHGDVYTCADKYNPGVLQPHKWENAMTIDKQSWGYRRNANIEEFLTAHELIEQVVETVSCGGNILINVGPTKEGTIGPIFQERLLQLGSWLSVNGDAIYETKPWTVQNDTYTAGVWYTAKDDAVYAIALNWPVDGVLSLGFDSSLFGGDDTQVTLLGYHGNGLSWKINDDRVDVTFPQRDQVASDWAWVLEITPSTKKTLHS